MNPLRNACMNEIKRTFKDAKFLNNGISVSTNDYLSVFKCRTFYEALLYTKSGLSLSKEKLFSYIAYTLKSGFISSCHSNNETPFYYRVEVKSTMNKERKVKLIDDVKKYIDKEIPSYINNPSLYEFEIRIVEKENMFDVFFKLFTVDDNRYSYRVTDLPASINPTTAAILIQEIKGYLKDTSEVLDAFCGTSTMLIERSFAKSYKSLTGIDISEDAISYSMINANNVPLKINLVCENILKYQGPEFDEIISNMPFGNRVSNHELNITLYKRFIASIDKMLKPNGMAFLLTSEIALMKELINKNKNIRLVKNIYVESGGLKPHFFVVKKVA
jgi:tRNA G10  N-methylase Trm11